MRASFICISLFQYICKAFFWRLYMKLNLAKKYNNTWGLAILCFAEKARSHSQSAALCPQEWCGTSAHQSELNCDHLYRVT